MLDYQLCAMLRKTYSVGQGAQTNPKGQPKEMDGKTTMPEQNGRKDVEERNRVKEEGANRV